MLTYHQAFDIYHSAFRTLNILNAAPDVSFEIERLRIFDFLILFPHDLKNVQLPAGYNSFKNLVKETKYNAIPNRQKVFLQTGKYFNLSLSCLLSYGIIDIRVIKENKVRLVPTENLKLFQPTITESSINAEILNFLMNVFLKMNLSELKKRTGLLEYRYDLFNS